MPNDIAQVAVSTKTRVNDFFGATLTVIHPAWPRGRLSCGCCCNGRNYCDHMVSTYAYYESGRSRFNIDVLIGLADLYEVSLDFLTGRNVSCAKCGHLLGNAFTLPGSPSSNLTSFRQLIHYLMVHFTFADIIISCDFFQYGFDFCVAHD